MSSVTSNRPAYSCARCADRKVKCDRRKPCSACVRHKVECIFNPTRPTRKRHKRVDVLTERLRHYEALLQEQGIETAALPESLQSATQRRSSQVNSATNDEIQLLTPSSVDSEQGSRLNKLQVLHGSGRSKYLENGLWTRVVEEFDDHEDALEDSSETSDLDAGIDDLVLEAGPRSLTDLRPRHPPPEYIHQLWQVYTERIDPLTKILHVPTLRPAILKAASDIESVPRSLEALLFAIYAVAIMSLEDEECRERFDEIRAILLSRYIAATKAALARAKFMSTINLVVLQALMLHLLVTRDIYEPRAIWSLTGVAVRIAHSMGLDRDGDFLNLPPFESEMRRRLWWLLKTHDFRIAELCGLAKFRDLELGGESTRGPTSINDCRLYPGMTSLVAETDKVTDAVFVVLRHELSSFAGSRIAKSKKSGKDYSQWTLHATGKNQTEVEEAAKEINDATRDIEELLETKYLRYCDPSQPLHLMTMLMARVAMNNIRFLSHHPRRWVSLEQTPAGERQWIWEISLKQLEQHEMSWTSPQLKPFAWQATSFVQWHIVIHVLDTLRATPLVVNHDRAWELIASTYKYRPHMISDMRKQLHVAVSILCLKAYDAREKALLQQNGCLPLTPDFILQLRHRREAEKLKRLARNTKINSTGKTDGQSPKDNGRQNIISDVNQTGATSPPILDASQHNIMPLFPNTEHALPATTDDPFRFVHGLDYGQTSQSDDLMNLDPEFMLSEDWGMGDSNTSMINWQQWDAWLANSNFVPPLQAHQI